MRGHNTLTDMAMRQRGWLLVREAARKINVTSQTIYTWINTGKVVGMRDGYRRFVRWSSVLAHIGQEACEARGLKQEDVYVETDS